ncbi:MAG: lysine--tRNA ligase, partial [Alkalispirochaeta sp.]
HAAPVEITDPERRAIVMLREVVKEGLENFSEKDVQNRIYEIARGEGIEPKEFFPVLYNVLVGKDQGPRLGGFLKTLGAERVTAILARY